MKISGRPQRNAFSNASTQKGTSIVTDNAQLSTNRLYQSITATRYTNPSDLKISGRPQRNAFSNASTQKGTSIVTDNAQLSTNRLYQSITATRYTNPCAIRMYVMSVLHTWLTRFTSTPPADTDRSCVRHLAGSASASDRWRRFRSAPSSAPPAWGSPQTLGCATAPSSAAAHKTVSACIAHPATASAADSLRSRRLADSRGAPDSRPAARTAAEC